MKLLRFHLSTLLALCVGAGAVVGLYLTSDLWLHETSMPLNPNSAPELYHRYPWIPPPVFGASNTVNEPARTETGDFCWLSNDLLERSEARTGGSRIDTFLYRATGPREFLAKTELKNAVTWIKYSPDSQHMAVGQPDRISFYRRSHAYGRQSLYKLPLFWVAALCFLFLIVRFVRYAFGAVRHLRARRTRAQNGGLPGSDLGAKSTH